MWVLLIIFALSVLSGIIKWLDITDKDDDYDEEFEDDLAIMEQNDDDDDD